MKKVENIRSHSWWWDSHVSPKNSKWLQENLSEMDSKVSAMLRIIEEDADSFAQRAEMFYKKRPELINLVEEFYRTYRALVERYTYLTREIRQNIAPALQAQLGVSSESAQNSPVDLHSKRGIDGPDIISPSYSYTGASEFDYDSPTAVSTKGQTDDEFSPLGFRTNFERRAFGFKSTFPNLEESSSKISESGMVQDTVHVDTPQLQKELLRLQEENKELSMKATEDVTKLKNLQLELSSLQSRLRSLEADDKLTKKRLKSVQEKEQKLEAENLKFSHALISLKEERTELLEQQKKATEDVRVAYQKNELLQDEKEDLRAELMAAQSQHLESSGNLKKSEEVVQKLELVLTTLKEERLKDLFLMEIYEQQSQDLLKKISDLEKNNAGLTEQAFVQVADVQKLQEQLTNVLENTSVLEQVLHATTHEKTCTEHEKFVALSQVKDFQEKVEVAKKEREQQAAEIAKLMEIICKLEEEGLRVRSEKLESGKYVHKLEASLEDGQRFKETLLASCQQYEDECSALELKYIESNERLLSSSQERSRLQHQVQTLEDMITGSQLQCKELQEKISSLVVEKTSLMAELEIALGNAKVAEVRYAEMHEITKYQKEEIEGLQKELVKQFDSTRRLEEERLHAAKEKAALVEKETEALMAYQQLENEHTHLKQELELKLALTEDMNHKLSCLELDKSELVLESQKMQQNLLELRTVNDVLSSNCLTSDEGLRAAEKEVGKTQKELASSLLEVEKLKEGLRAAEKGVGKTQKELASSLLEVEKLKEDGHAKRELLRKMESDFEGLETHLARYMEANSLLSKDINKCSKNLAAIEAENNDLKSRLSDVVTLNTALAEQVSEKEKIFEQSNHELSVARTQVVALNEDIASKTSQTLDLQQQISSLEKQVKLLCAEILESSLVKQSLEAVVEGLQLENSETKVANKALSHEQRRLSSDILTLKSFNQDLEANLIQVKREKASLQEDAITLTNQCIDLKQKITTLETDCRAEKVESATLRDQLAESEREIMSSSKKLFKAEGRVQDLQLKLSKMLAEEASLAEQLVERIGKIQNLETGLLDLQKDKKALSEELGVLQQQISALRTREASLLEEMHESSELIQRLTEEQERLRQVVLNAEETEKRLSLEHREGLEECLLLQQKMDNMQQDLEICCKEKAVFLKDAANHLERSTELECEVKRFEAEKNYLQQELFRAQQVEHRLKEDMETLIEERQELSGTLDIQRKKVEKQEEELESLQGVISSTKEGQQILMDKVNLLAEEKAALLQVFKNNKQESERTKEKCLKLQTDISHLQHVTTSSESERDNMMKELRVLQETTWSLKVAKSELEQKLESCSRQALLQEDKEKRVLEMLTAAQEENLKLGLDLVDAQKRILETDEEFDRHRKGQGNASKFSSLQEELLSVRNLKLEMAEKHSKLTDDWVATERKLQEEILQLRSASFQQKNELELQDKRVLELEEEVCQLQAEKEALQSDKVSNKKQMLGLQQQVGDLKAQLSEKQVESSKLSSQAMPLSTKEDINLELQRQVQLLMEENKQLVKKLQNSDRDLVQMKGNFDMQENRLHELRERLCESQNESKLKERSCQAQAEESALIKEENTELTDALSKAQAQNAWLEAKLAAEAAALVSVKHELSVLQEESEKVEKACVHEGQVADLHELLLDVQDEFETGKKRACNAAEEGICHWQATSLQVLKRSKNNQLEQESCDNSITCLELLQQELATERAENTKLARIVSDEALLVNKLQEEKSNLQNGRQGLECAIHVLKGQLEEAEKAREESLCALQDRSKDFLQMIYEIEDLNKMFCDNLEGKHHSAMLEENSTVYQMEQVNLPQTVLRPESGKQSLLPEVFAAGRVAEKALTFPQMDGMLSDSIKMKEAGSSSSWILNHDQQSLSDAAINTINRIKKNIFLLVNESHQAQVLTSTNKLQGQVSKSQEEIEHLILEVNSYKKEVSYLKNVLHGEDLQAEGEVAHEDVIVLLEMVHNLHHNVVTSEGKIRELEEELRRELVQRRSLQLLLTELEAKGHSYMVLLRKNLLLSCKRLRELASEWKERASDREKNQISNSIEKLSRAEAVCNSSNSQDDDNSGCIEEGTCLQPEASQLTDACILLLGQLQRRVEESSLLSEAVEDMLPSFHWQDQRKDGNEQGACGTFKESKDDLLIDKNSHLHQEQHQQFRDTTEHIKSDIEFDIEMADSDGAITPEGDESEIVETVSFDQKKEIELIEGLAQLRINLGMRLHQALMDEKLETELQELKEEREKLKDELQARVEQVHGMEAELEKLQVFLKGASAEGDMLDPKQQQQWLRRKKRAEKRARKLSRELVLQRQHVGKMHDAVVAWAEQQERATEILEKQVLFLVSKECAPTMDGWDAHQVTQLMQEMQSRKALARRHSMDLQSVEEDLQRVGSSIESTQRQLLEDEQKQQASQNRISKKSISVNAASDTAKDHRKLSRLGLSRFGLTWLLLLFSTRGRTGGLAERGPNHTTSATVVPPNKQQLQTSSSSSIALMSSFMAQTTRKLRCCGCAPNSHRSSSDNKSLDENQ